MRKHGLEWDEKGKHPVPVPSFGPAVIYLISGIGNGRLDSFPKPASTAFRKRLYLGVWRDPKIDV